MAAAASIRVAAELKLNDLEHAVLQAIEPAGSMLDDVAAACGLPIHRVLSTVSVLESRRLVPQRGREPGGTNLNRSGARAAFGDEAAIQTVQSNQSDHRPGDGPFVCLSRGAWPY